MSWNTILALIILGITWPFIGVLVWIVYLGPAYGRLRRHLSHLFTLLIGDR